MLVEQVEVVVAVPLTLYDKQVAVPGQEHNRVQRLNVFLAGLTVELLEALASRRVVADQSAVVLVAVQFKEINGLPIWTPRDVGEINGSRSGGSVATYSADRCPTASFAMMRAASLS